jgi:hypothetical protein
MRLFAERFLISPTLTDVPEPARYDEDLAVSVTADGLPFVESLSAPLVTITKADGEASDAITNTITRTFTEGEGIDEPPEPPMPMPPDPPRPEGGGWGVTITRAEGERPDRNDVPGLEHQASRDVRRAYGLWGITKTSAPGEKPDR